MVAFLSFISASRTSTPSCAIGAIVCGSKSGKTNCDAHVLIPHSVLHVCFTVPSLLMPFDTGTNEVGQLPSPTSIGTELAVRASRLRRNLSCSFRNLRAFLSRINLQRR